MILILFFQCYSVSGRACVFVFSCSFAGSTQDCLEPTYVTTSHDTKEKEKEGDRKDEKEKEKERDRARTASSPSVGQREKNPILDVACGYHHTLCLDGASLRCACLFDCLFAS